MKIELRAVTIHPRSESPGGYIAFSAQIVIDGIHTGHMSASGMASMVFRPCGATALAARANISRYEEADHWCRNHLPPWSLGGLSAPADLESHIEDLLIEHYEITTIETLMETHALIARADVPGILPFKTRLPPTSPDMLKGLARRFPGSTILNTKPPREAYALFRAAETAARAAHVAVRAEIHDWKGFGSGAEAL